MRTVPLSLGIITARPGVLAENAYWVDAGLGRLVDALASHFAHTTLALSLASERHALLDHRLALPASDVVPLPPMPSLVQGFWQWRASMRVIREVERRSDVLLVQLPFAAPIALAGSRRARVYQVCADIKSIVGGSSYYVGPRGVAARMTASLVDHWQRHLAHSNGARSVTHGQDLLHAMRIVRGRSVVSSSLREDEIASVPRQRPRDDAFHVLFVGYLRHEKGIDTLIDAFERLLDRVPHAELDIVGAKNIVDHGTEQDVQRALGHLGQRTRVTFHGGANFGAGLFQHYADADVLVVPSRSEGTPRVLVEARAFGCPVIATRVGGIPSSIEDGIDGLLVAPDAPETLAQAMERVALDPDLRARLVTGGLARAKSTTVEHFAAAIAEELIIAAQDAA
ncbi:MAG: glycosyltransferase family 4 protein [Myxococcota bacterium]